jgi:predicted phosphodiesterase
MKTKRLQTTSLLLASLLAANTWAALAGPVTNNGHPPTTGPVRFAVISDPHLYDARLGTSGLAWQETLYRDPKLLKESEPILQSALASIVQQNVQFLIISGDLTKDGELVDHVLMAQYLAKLEQRGIQVFVVPGNHDINNPYAVTYIGDGARRVPNVSPETFRALYQRFGYGQALARDPNSLSYVAEPVPGLWLLGIDSCKYQDNEELGYPVIGGRISPETMSWVLGQLQSAHAAGKQVIAFMHHGVNLHFYGEDVVFPDYLVDDWQNVSAQLAAAGLKVVFTGHYHAQDAAYPVDGVGQPILTLCDVETASLAQYPCAYRIVTIQDGQLNIQSQRVTEADVDTGGLPFQQFADQNLRELIQVQIDEELTNGFGLTPQQLAFVAPLVTDALVANYAGDEVPSPATLQVLQYLIAAGPPTDQLGYLLLGIWTDLWPGDHALSVPLGPVSNAVPGTGWGPSAPPMAQATLSN